MNQVLSAIWEWPQKLIGAIVKKLSRAVPFTVYNETQVYSWKWKGGISLGNSIFIPYSTSCSPSDSLVLKYIKHEYGHTCQSHMLGWFYLLVIGLPSIIWAGCFKEYRKKNNISYYSFFTEKWADQLGGVVREEEE